MNRDFKIRFTGGLLILLTTAGSHPGLDQFPEEAEFQIPLTAFVDGAVREATVAGRHRVGGQTAPARRPVFGLATA